MPPAGRSFGILDQGDGLQRIFDIPETKIDRSEERAKASLHLTKRWKAIRGHLESRQRYYQQYLPGNIPLGQITASNYQEWIVAQKTAYNMINEIQTLIDMVDGTYERVRQAHG